MNARQCLLALGMAVALGLADAAAGHGAAAQRLAPAAAPVDVAAEPATTVVGGEVTLRGSSLALKDLAMVRLDIQPPQGAVETLEAVLDESDSYSITYRTRAAGKHGVTAFSPDGKRQATTSFEAAKAGAVSDQSAKALSGLTAAARELAATICAAAGQLPPSPPQQKLSRESCDLVRDLEAVPETIESFRKGLVEIDALVEHHPETLIEVQVAYIDLAEITVAATTAETDLADRMKRLKAGITTCDRMDRLVDAYDFLGIAWSLPAAGLKRINNLIAGRVLPARITTRFPDLASSPIVKRFVDMGVPTMITAARGIVTKWEYVSQRATSLATLGADLALRAFCEKFIGPVEGRLDLEYYEGNARWLAYSVVLDGFLTIRYEKGKPSAEGTPITGELEGIARFPALKEDLRAIQPAVTPHVYARKAWPPVMGVVPYPQPELGKFGRATLGALRAAPGYFFVPVEGLLRESTLMLRLKPATVDYPDRALGKIAYVLWSPQMLVPQVMKFDVKYQGAHFILSRAVHKERGKSAEPFPLPVTVDEARKISLIEQRFARTEEDPGSFRLRWNLHVKACNPACPP